MGFGREEEMMMMENRAKTESKTEEMEIAMATIGLVLLIAAAKHYASTSLAQQWRSLLVFFLLNLLLVAILFASSSLTTRNEIKNSTGKMKRRKKNNHNKKEVSNIDEKIKMGKKSKKSASSTTISSCNGNNSWYLSSVKAVEDYFCKISEVEQEKMNRSTHDERKNEHFEVCDDSVTVNDDHTPTNLSSTTTSNSKEDIDARVEAFIVMFRQQLAMDALQSTTSSVMQSRNGAGIVSK